jgi:hypothetical protein
MATTRPDTRHQARLADIDAMGFLLFLGLASLLLV